MTGLYARLTTLKNKTMNELNKNGITPRYIVDERNGCIAIRDTEHPKFKESGGINQDLPDVVYFEMGTKIDTGKFITWDIDPKTIRVFHSRCNYLNGV